MAIKTRKFQIVNDVNTAPEFAPWKRQATRSNLLAFASFPILVHNKVYGVLNLAAREKNHFSPGEVVFLELVARFLAFGIQAQTDREMNLILEERNVVNNLLVETFMQNSDAAVAIFDSKEPYMCRSANHGFLTMLDEPYRSTGIEDSLLSDFAGSHIQRDIYDALHRAIEDVEPQYGEGEEFKNFDGAAERWNWFVFPIMHEDKIISLLYFAMNLTKGAGGDQMHVLSKLDAAVYSVNFEERKVRYANPAAERAFGLKTGAKAVHAVPFAVDIPNKYHKDMNAKLEALAAGKTARVLLAYQAKDRTIDGQRKFCQIVTGDYSEAGTLRGVFSAVVPMPESAE